jgi:membrane protease subunit HflC
MKSSAIALSVFLGFVGLILLTGSIYRVMEWEQAIVTEFGRRVGDPVTETGIHFKKPFIQKVTRFDKRVLEWDGPPAEMPTRDKLFVIVDTFARWKITDAGKFFERLRDERSAASRLDDILGGETRSAVARHDLIEIIRTTRDRQPASSTEVGTGVPLVRFDPIRLGRPGIEHEIYSAAKPKLAEFGIDLLDVRFKRINYNPSVEARIYERMISERQQIAERFRSEGAGEAARILGDMEREVNTIKSTAYKQVQTIAGEAEAKATAIYATAYNSSPTAAEFYRFLKTLDTYKTSLGGDTTAILSTTSPLLRYLQDDTPPETTE